MRISVVNRSMCLGKLSMVVCDSGWVLTRVAVRFPYGWQALVSCSKELVDAGKPHLLVSEGVSV